jgi:hypothetical protein
MSFIHTLRRLILSGPLLLALLFVASLQASAAPASPARMAVQHTTSANAAPFNAQAEQLRQLVREGKLAPTVHVLSSLPPTTIIQFPLVPSGIKAAFPNATGLVTIVRGNRDNSVFDTVTVDVQHMPPNITFTIFLIELANKPFGNVEYMADLTTRGDGSGETVFEAITLVAFAMDARNPGTSQDNREGTTSGINLEHLGMWFSSLQDAQKVLNNDTLTGTIFDGGNPPLHAGPQAMTDGQTAPVF